jgi:DNA-binding MltR family transcriptional regulator
MMKFEVDGTEYEFVESMTFGEARSLEKVCGVPFSQLADPKNQGVDFMAAQVWISMRRVNPDLTFDDLDDLDMSVLLALAEEKGDEPEVPTDAEDADTTTTSAQDA